MDDATINTLVRLLGAVNDASGDLGPIADLEEERHALFKDGVQWEHYSELIDRVRQVHAEFSSYWTGRVPASTTG